MVGLWLDMTADTVIKVYPSEIVASVMKFILFPGVSSFFTNKDFLATSIANKLPFLSPASK